MSAIPGSSPVDDSSELIAEPPVLVTDADGVRLLTLNRPRVRNAIDLATALAIEAGLDEFEASPELRVLVLAGQGSTFCAGMDLKAFLRGERPSTAKGGFAGLVERTITKPIIAAVEGPAIAGGFELVLACDMVVAASDATFGLPEVKRGLVAGGGGLMRLSERLPVHRALQLALTGAVISADQAAEWGLLNQLTERGQAVNAALDLAEAITANGPLALAATKRIVRESAHWPPEESFTRQRELSEPVRATDDAREGASAFLEKRAPRWQGR